MPERAQTRYTAIWSLSERSGSYLVLSSDGNARDFRSGLGLLVNIEIGSAEALTGSVSGLTEPVFSADGRYLRYVSHESPDSDTWIIRERTLTSGDERSIYTLSAAAPIVESDLYGDTWLVENRELVHNDGSHTKLAEVPAQLTRLRRLFEHDLLSFPLTCEAKYDCTLDVQPLKAGPLVRYRLPPGPSVNLLNLIYRLDRERLLVSLADNQSGLQALWILTPDAPAQRIGVSAVEKGVFPQVAPNQRYVAVLDESQTSYRVWEIAAGKFVFENPLPANVTEFPKVRIRFGDTGFVVNEGMSHFWLYRTDKGNTLRLPGEKRLYFDLLPDGTIIYREDDPKQSPGIYPYDPATDTATLLVPNARPVVLGN